MKKIGIISDTHGVFDGTLERFLAATDEIWHAGDIGSAALMDRISRFKPLRAVYGNIDDAATRAALEEYSFFRCENVSVLMTHIGDYPGRYTPQTTQRILSLKPDIVITGHSHILKVMYDKRHELLHINPGAAGKYGMHTMRTAIRLEIDGADIRNLEVGEWPKQERI